MKSARHQTTPATRNLATLVSACRHMLEGCHVTHPNCLPNQLVNIEMIKPIREKVGFFKTEYSQAAIEAGYRVSL